MKKQYIILLMLVALVPIGVNAQSTMTLPYSMNFEGLPTGGASFVPGWTRVDSAISGNAIYPNVYSYGSSQGNVLSFNGNSATTSGTMRAATPLIPAPLNSLELSFAVYKNTLTLYAATDPADQSTYHLIGSYAPGYSWTTYEVRTDTVSGMPANTGYLVFTANHGTGYGNDNPYLDDLTIVALNPCARPTEVTVGNIGPSSAVVNWPAVTGAQAYEVSYDTVDNMATAFNVQSVTGTSLTLTELEPGTTYYVWVQTDCGNGLSDARTATFTTQLSCYSVLNLTQVGSSMDAASFQWEYDTRGYENSGVMAVLHDQTDSTVADLVDFVTGTSYIVTGLDRTHEYTLTIYTLCDIDTAAGASVAIYFRNCGESNLYSGANDHIADFPISTAYQYSYSQVLYDADVFYGMDTIRGVALHRFVDANSAAMTRTVSIYMGNSSLDSLTSYLGTTGMTQVANGVNFTLAAQEWDTLMFTTPFIYDGTSNVVLTMVDNTGTGLSLSAAAQWYWHSTESKTIYNFSTSSTYAYSDHKQYKQPDVRFVGVCNSDFSCEPPVVAMGDVDSLTAEIIWFGDPNVSYVVEYRSQGGGSWTVVDTVIDLSYIMNGLNPASRYEVRVGVICDGRVRYSASVTFSTLCALMHIPFHFSQNDMIAAAENGFGDCWNFSRYIYRGRLTDSHRGYVRNAGNGEWIMLPAIAEPLQGARLRTWVGTSDHGYFKVGIASQDDCSDVVWIDTVEVPANNPNTSHNEFISYLDNYMGLGDRVVLSPIVNNNYHYMYFFDFHLEPIEGCRPAIGLELDSADATSLTFHWRPVGAATSWAVFVDGVQNGVATTPSFTATGLNAYTRYDVSVYSLCDDGDTSDAVTARFLTGCTGESCRFTVNTHSASGDGWRGAHLDISTGDTAIGNITMLNGSHASYSFLVCSDMTVVFSWLSGNSDEVCSFEVLNAAGDTVYRVSQATETMGDSIYVTDSLCGSGENPGPGPGPGPGPEGIDDVDGSNVVIYPNPTTDKVTIAGIEGTATVTLLDFNGREVYHRDGVSGSVMVDVENFAKGVYFARIVSDSSCIVCRMIVN